MMNIVIIEDEPLTAEDLKDIILMLSPESKILKTLNSVEESLTFFETPRDIDLIFSDIQLGDGLSFEIFKQRPLNAPIIFCTAYDEYALIAFDTNGIHYVLKPFNENKIAEALDKFKNLKKSFKTESDTLNKVIDIISKKHEPKENSLLVYKKDRIIPLKINGIALFYIENGITRLITFDGETFNIDKTLNDIQLLCNNNFYRANRQFIVHRNAIKEVGENLSRKSTIFLNFPFSQEILVSKERKIDFLDWLKGN